MMFVTGYLLVRILYMNYYEVMRLRGLRLHAFGRFQGFLLKNILSGKDKKVTYNEKSSKRFRRLEGVFYKRVYRS